MIKLVASDLDGTILRNGAQSVDASTIEVIDKLLSAGVLFAPASGRQIVSLKRLLCIYQRMAHSANIRVKL